ncbi:MAG: MBL fold metallo-hydrolase [Myxococcota bacterium]
MLKKILIALGVVVLLVVAALAPIVSAFLGLVPVQPVTELPGGVVAVADGYVQAFIIPTGEGGAALIDCGQDPTAKALKAKLDELKLTVKAIFVTHGHGDHVGGCVAFPDAPLYALEAERALVEGTTAAKGPITRFGKNDATKAHKVARSLSDGETVELGAAQVQVFAIPGHTAGSAAFLANGVLFLGDSATVQTDGKIRNAPWVFSDDTEQCRQSLLALAKRVDASRVQAMAFAHSGPRTGLSLEL